jgi:hypothetical protein
MAGRLDEAMRRRANFAFLAALVAILGVSILREKSTQPPPVATALPFDTARAIERGSRILGDKRPHSVDSEASDEVGGRLVSKIRPLGYEAEARDYFSRQSSVRWRTRACACVRNVVFRTGPSG